MDYLSFQEYITQKRPIHLCGIGGVSMRALARILREQGAAVQGTDRDDSPAVRQLVALGIPVSIGHEPEYSAGAALIIRTAAVKDDNPEILAARARGIPVLERAEAWGLLMSRYRHSVCVAGTHGKTSTTGMLAAITLHAGCDPTVMIGGEAPVIGGSLRIGGRELIVAEACEYQNSFLYFAPTIAVILNIDRDHLDFFHDTADIIGSFRRFAQLVPPKDGLVVLNNDDPNSLQLMDCEQNIRTFGLTANADVYPENIETNLGLYSCDVIVCGEKYARISLKVPGRHNMLNALAAAAVAHRLGIDGAAFAEGLALFTGVGRRFEYKGEIGGAKVYDDYAHHPTEISSTLQAARAMEPERLICLFQPHTYSRTASLLAEFALALKEADLCLLTDIYAAREKNQSGITAKAISDRVEGALYTPSLEEAAEALKGLARPGDLILTMGAGNVADVYPMMATL